MIDKQLNQRRSTRGMNIVNTNERYKDSRNSIGDVLLDLMHYANHSGIDFAAELKFATEAFGEDTINAKVQAKVQVP